MIDAGFSFAEPPRMCPRLIPRSMSILLLLLALSPRITLADQPFSFDTTPGKLPKTVVPRHYTIRLEPDLNKFTTRGSMTVDLEIRQPISEIVLNALDIDVTQATLIADHQTALKINQNDDKQLVTLKLPAPISPGNYRLALEFTGHITEQAQGLFYVRYAAPSGKKIMLATQMEPTDARRMFPCWDEPVFRATYDLTVVVPQKHLAVSNMPIEHETSLPNGLKEVKFMRTPPMASYLVVLVSGELEELKDEADGVKIRVITTEGKREQAVTRWRPRKKVLAYYNDYFGIRYPLPKLDQIAIPGGFERRDGELGRHHLQRKHAALRSQNQFAADQARHLRDRRARDGPSMVRRSRHHGLVGQSLAQRRLRLLDGNQGHRSFQSRLANVAHAPASRKSGVMSERRPQTTHPIQQRRGQRKRGQRRLRQHHLQQGPGLPAHAGKLPRREAISQGHPPLPRRASLFQHHHGRSLERAWKKPPANPSRALCRRLDRATRPAAS